MHLGWQHFKANVVTSNANKQNRSKRRARVRYTFGSFRIPGFPGTPGSRIMTGLEKKNKFACHSEQKLKPSFGR